MNKIPMTSSGYEKLQEELKNEGLTASFLINIKDVTEKVLAELNSDMSEKERSAKIRDISKILVEEKIAAKLIR